MIDAEDDRVLERLREICRAFPEAEEATLQDRPLFHVRRRRFAIFNGDDAPPRPRWAGAGRSLHFLTDPTERDALRADPRFSASPHHGDRGWMALAIPSVTRTEADTARGTDDRVTTAPHWREIAELLEAAYRTAAPRQLVEQLEQFDEQLDERT